MTHPVFIPHVVRVANITRGTVSYYRRDTHHPNGLEHFTPNIFEATVMTKEDAQTIVQRLVMGAHPSASKNNLAVLAARLYGMSEENLVVTYGPLEMKISDTPVLLTVKAR